MSDVENFIKNIVHSGERLDSLCGNQEERVADQFRAAVMEVLMEATTYTGETPKDSNK